VFAEGVNYSFGEKCASQETARWEKLAFLMENDVVVDLVGEAMCVYVQVKKTGEIFCNAEDNYLAVAVVENYEYNLLDHGDGNSVDTLPEISLSEIPGGNYLRNIGELYNWAYNYRKV
jgi:hypothetical protein